MLHKASIANLVVEQNTKQIIVILKAEESEQVIPIWIGQLEGYAIVSALNDIKFGRPMTHDLFKNFLDMLEIYISRIDVCDIKDDTYYAEIHYISKDKEFSMDARPSDAIAMAVRFKAPIFVDDRVINKSKRVIENVEVLDQSEDGEKWAEYLKKLNPEDFGKYKV
jgi:bifunctional DNase/RNase